MPNWLNQQETLDDIAAMLCNDITHIYARHHSSGNWKLSSSRIPICQSRAKAHGICVVPALDHDDDEEIASEKINWERNGDYKKKQQMWKIGKEQKSGKLFDKLIGSWSWVTVTIRRWLWGSLLSLNEVLWPTFQLFSRYLTININGRLWQELGVQHWEIPMEPLTNMAMNNPKRKYWHCGM